MPRAEVRDRVRRLLERHVGDERALDAYWQWATDPTPPGTVYDLEENAGFMATNLLRHGRPAIDLVEEVAARCRELQDAAPVSDLRTVLITELNGPLGYPLREGILRRLVAPLPGRRLLVAWLVARWRWYQGWGAWLPRELDWALEADLLGAGRDVLTPLGRAMYGEETHHVDLAREAMAAGVANRLLYRTPSGRVDVRLRPGPRIPLEGLRYWE